MTPQKSRNPQPSPQGTQVVSRIAAILQAVASGESAGSTAAIAHRTGLTRPTAHRLLAALAAEGFVDRTEDGNWALGPELHILGTVAAQRYPAQDLATPCLQRLAEATGESAFFSARRGNEVILSLIHI